MWVLGIQLRSSGRVGALRFLGPSQPQVLVDFVGYDHSVAADIDILDIISKETKNVFKVHTL